MNVLTITVVVSIFCFAGLCIIGYGNISEDFLETARSRQRQPLLEIPEPERLKEQPVSAVSTQTVPLASSSAVDTDVLVQELLPLLSDELLDQLEARLVSRAQGYLPQLEAQLLTDLAPSLEATLAERLEAQLLVRAESYIPQLVDRLIPELVPQVVASLEANLDAYMPVVADALKPHFEYLTEDDMVTMYNEYRAAIIKDLVPLIVPEVLDALEASLVSKVASDSAVAPSKIPAAPVGVVTSVVPSESVSPPMESDVSALSSEAVSPESLVSAPVSVPTAPTVTTSVAASVPADDEPSVPAAPSVSAISTALGSVEESASSLEPVVQVPAAPTTLTPRWSVPVVDETGEFSYVDPDTYASQREAIRQQEIQKILDMLQD